VNQRRIRLAALVTAALVLIAGIAFTVARSRDYESVATVVLSPTTTEAGEITTLLESFERSGTQGTYVELMASDDTTAKARATGVSITVRAVPNTRAIRIVAKGDQEDVVPALRSVISATEARQASLSDLFALQILESPSAPSLSGPGTGVLLLATLLLAIFAAIAVVVILRRFGPGARQPVQSALFRAAPTRPEP
jgi:capsular polysaccharide biosynthesis protein